MSAAPISPKAVHYHTALGAALLRGAWAEANPGAEPNGSELSWGELVRKWGKHTGGSRFSFSQNCLKLWRWKGDTDCVCSQTPPSSIISATYPSSTSPRQPILPLRLAPLALSKHLNPSYPLPEPRQVLSTVPTLAIPPRKAFLTRQTPRPRAHLSYTCLILTFVTRLRLL